MGFLSIFLPCSNLPSVLCVGTYAPWTYYGFYCRPTPRTAYLVAISVLCLATIVITLADRSGRIPRIKYLNAQL